MIPTFNGKEDTRECLESLRTLNYPNYDILIVDNGSMDGTQDMVKTTFPGVGLIQNKENLAVAGGYNVGIRNSDGEYIFFLNNDLVIRDPETMDKLLEVFNNNENVAAVGPLICYYDEPDRIQGPTPARYDSHSGKALYLYDDGAKVSEVKQRIEDVTFLAGPAILMRREVLDKTGLWDEDFFLIEDRELFMRVVKNGYKVYFVPSTVIYHKKSRTLSRIGPKQSYYNCMNYLRFHKRHVDPGGFYRIALHFLLKTLPLIVYYHVRDERGFRGAIQATKGTFCGLVVAIETPRYKAGHQNKNNRA